MTYPALAALRCSDCQKHVYTIPEAVLQTYEVDDDVHLPVLREVPPPCESCPKGGPENDEQLRLSDRNYQAWMLYEKLQSTFGAYRLPEYLAGCDLFALHMFLVRRSIEAGRAAAQANAYDRARSERDQQV